MLETTIATYGELGDGTITIKEIENIIKIVRTASDSIEKKITDAIKSTRTLNGNYFYKQLGETLK